MPENAYAAELAHLNEALAKAHEEIARLRKQLAGPLLTDERHMIREELDWALRRAAVKDHSLRQFVLSTLTS